MKNKVVLESCLEEIYLGNLGTVETDLILPAKTKDGISINWQSSRPSILEHNGKVHRPESKDGNQTVVLKAVAGEGNAVISKEYQVTIVALPVERLFVRQLPMEFGSKINTQFRLPGCAILELEDGTVSLPVRWEQDGIVQVEEERTYRITGKLEEQETKRLSCGDTYEMKYRIRNAPPLVTAYVTGLPDESYTEPEVPVRKVCEAQRCQVKLQKDGKFTEDVDRMLDYILSYKADSLLYNFRQAAGIPVSGVKPMLGWEAPESNLRGHTTGHYLSAVALAYEVTKDERLEKKAKELIDGLYEVQQKYTAMSEEYEGYLSAYPVSQFSDLEKGAVYPAVWAPYYTLHKIMAGLLDCYKAFQEKTALEMVCRIGIWVYNRLGKLPKETLNRMWFTYIAGEFGGINETLAELYQMTRDDRFLEAARWFDNDALFYPMSRNIDVLGGIHANQHIPQMIGALRLFEATGQIELFHAAYYFEAMVREHHSYAIGGVGNAEMFRNADRIGSELSEKNAESCCSYNMLKLTKKIFEYDPSPVYADYYERVLLNHILANSNKQYGGATTYFMGMQPGAQKNYRAMENTCCHGTGLESKFRYGEGIYYTTSGGVYINLFLNSTLALGKDFILEQEIMNEERSRIHIVVREGGKEARTLKIRIPGWCDGNFDILYVKHPEKVQVRNGYIEINDRWEKDDRIHIRFSCFLRVVRPKDRPELFSIFYGPFVLALLDDSEEFIHFDEEPEQMIQKIQQRGALDFRLGKYEWKPLYQIVDEKYHIYMKHRHKEHRDE